jgi:hypothetical protein
MHSNTSLQMKIKCMHNIITILMESLTTYFQLIHMFEYDSLLFYFISLNRIINDNT